MSILYLVCLLSPVAFSVIRKILPEQPNFLEPMGIAVVFIVGILALTRQPRLPKFLAIPLIIWAAFQGFYALLSVFFNIRIGAAGFFVNVIPMLMMLIAYQGTTGLRELKWIGNTFGIIGLIILPFGFYVAVFGNVYLPPLFLPNLEMIELGKATRAGIPAYAGIFSTQDVLSMVIMAVYFINLALFLGKRQRESFHWWYLIFAVVSFILVLLSTRRGGLLGIVGGSFMVLITGNISWKRKLGFAFSGFLALVVIVFLDTYFGFVYQEDTTRVFHAMNLDLWVRFKIFFWDVCMYWAEAHPFGTYLGNAGSEGIVFGSEIFLRGQMVETGGAKLIAEMGVMGALLMPAILFYVHWKIFRMKTAFHIHAIVRVLFAFNAVFYTLFYFKEWTAMSGGYVSQLFFWAIPGMCYALIERERTRRRRPIPMPVVFEEPMDGAPLPYGHLYPPPPPPPGPRAFR